MSIRMINPDGMWTSAIHTQVAVASGTKMVFIAGQVAFDEDRTVVGVGDLAVQVEQALKNITVAVESAGGTFADIAKLTLYVVGWTQDRLQPLLDGFSNASTALGIDTVRPMTLVGVATLSHPDFLIEIDAVAVLP